MRIAAAALLVLMLAGCNRADDRLPDDLSQAEGRASPDEAENDLVDNSLAEDVNMVPDVPEAPLQVPDPVPPPPPPSPQDPGPQLPPPETRAQPSFDCGLASNVVEHRICDDPELAAMDRDVARAYSRAMAEANPDQAARLRALGRQYLADRDRCRDDYCIRQAYRWYRRDIEGVQTHP